MAERPNIDFEVHWHPFQLNENVPPEGVDRDTFYKEKFGGESRVKGITDQLRTAGAPLGIDFDFGAIRIQPNTKLSHVLIDLAEGVLQSDVKERLLSAFFEKGEDIGDPTVLTRIGQELGMGDEDVQKALHDPSRLAQVSERSEAARSMGITGVPTFIFDRSQAFSGAQDEQQFLAVFDQLSAEG